MKILQLKINAHVLSFFSTNQINLPLAEFVLTHPLFQNNRFIILLLFLTQKLRLIVLTKCVLTQKKDANAGFIMVVK